MKIFNKLVRDNIPDIIRDKGEIPTVEILSDERFLLELNKKLDEEVSEYQESKELEELADILEVVYAICEAQGHTADELDKLRNKKSTERGGFSKKYFLVSKE